MSSTYVDVDGSEDPDGAVRWQDRIDAWPQIQAYKRRAHQLVGGAGPVLDIGCGPGSDVDAIGIDRAVGIDVSATMCLAAAARHARVARADGHALSFRDASFAAARADRVLQHVEHPATVIDEMLRVVRPGGRLVLADPDQETLVIHVPGVRRELTDRLKAVRRDIGYRHGRLASTLPTELRRRGLTEITVDAFPVLLTDPDDAFGLPGWPAYWRSEGGFTDADLAEWDRGIAAARREGCVYALLYLVVAGTTP